MMAMIAVEVVLSKLVTLLADEAQSLARVCNGVNGLKDDLEMMRFFLQAVEARGDKDVGVKALVKQVRDVAYEAEDVIEEFLLLLSPPNRGHGFFLSLRRGLFHLQRLRRRHYLSARINHIKEKIRGIVEWIVAFSPKWAEELAARNAGALQQWNVLPLAALFIDDADVVGIQHPKSLLISFLTGEDRNLCTVPVVGMGGIGKTTLVRKVYNSPAVKKCFDRQAWITVSKSWTVLELLRAALKDFLEEAKEPVPEEIGTMNELRLINNLKNYLQHKRYVIVFDDIWSAHVWEAVKFAFPDCCCGSRIIFTTRIGDIATSMETLSYVYNLQPLSDEEAWTLFCTKAFRGEYKGICPEDLQEMSWTIMKKCGGLPLAIVAMAGLLAGKEKHVLEWKKVLDSLFSEMKNNSSLESLERILLLSYNDLPYHLKCCILYVSIFPEDYLIKRMKLIRLWVAEGFVEERPGYTLEEAAEHYLNELVNRSMIQVVQTDYFNRVSTCQFHDVMREIIQLKSRDESFAMVLNDKRMPQSEKIYRMAIHGNCEDPTAAMGFTNLRSLLLFVSTDSTVTLGKPCFKGFKLLRVLELEKVPIYQFPQELTRMIHLKYLSLRRTMIGEIPESIRKLRSLEILDLKHCLISSLPKGILKLEKLRQLRCYSYHFKSSFILANSYGMQVPSEIGKLTSLEKLGSIEVNRESDKVIRELGKLTKLRRLGILKLTQKDGMHLCSSLEKLKHLTALYMVSMSNTEPLFLNSLSSPPELLQRFFLKCSLQSLPNWIFSLRFLAKLVLQYSGLKNDVLRALQGLPSLVVLELREAYSGEVLCCDVGGYLKLKKLSLKQLDNLKSVTLPQGAMPRLKELEIAICPNLETVPNGIEHLRELEYLLLLCMPGIFIQNINRHGVDFWKVQHITTIQVFC